jgi:hypothetical protein
MHASFVMQRARERIRELIAEAQRERAACLASGPIGMRARVAGALRSAASALFALGSAIERPQAV